MRHSIRRQPVWYNGFGEVVFVSLFVCLLQHYGKPVAVKTFKMDHEFIWA